MKKRHLRGYVRDADDYREAIERKLACMDEVLFFASMGMEYLYQEEDCAGAKVLQLLKEYLRSIRTGEMAGLRDALEQLKKV